MGVDVSRIAFAQREYRVSPAQEDMTVLTRHPLAIELDYNTLFRTEAEANAFGVYVLGLRKLDRWTWACFVKRANYPSLEIGQTITISYPRFGFNAGKNFIIKRLKTDSNALFDELTLFGPE